ncbi:hypothetical protein RSAG8_13511, partial [Rhizoctonia solani AG-8 WAC10335]
MDTGLTRAGAPEPKCYIMAFYLLPVHKDTSLVLASRFSTSLPALSVWILKSTSALHLPCPTVEAARRTLRPHCRERGGGVDAEFRVRSPYFSIS